MDTTTLIIVLLALLVIVLGATLLMQRRRSDHLRSQFGPEYERALKETGDKRKAEAALEQREKRVREFEIKPLEQGDREQFTGDWQRVQSEFVDNPMGAMTHADVLLQKVMTARGYPVENFDQVAADVSVDHPTVVQNYRSGHEIALRHKRGEAGTEDLRQAMIHYRDLFDELVTDGASAKGKSGAKPRRSVDESKRRKNH
jgi:hypothetical protein